MKPSLVIVVVLFCVFICTKAGIVSKSQVVSCNQEKAVETSLDEENDEPTVESQPCKKKLVISMTLRNAQVVILLTLNLVSNHEFRQKQNLCTPILTGCGKKVLQM